MSNPAQSNSLESPPVLEVSDLATHFFTDDGLVRAVDGVSFQVPRGESVCIVGESGSGKSVTGRSILQIVDRPGRVVGGSMLFRPTPTGEAVDLAKLNPRGKQIRSIRGNEIAMIFQEPMSALSPVHTIGDQISEAVMLHTDSGRKAARATTIEMLDRVGMPQPHERIDSYTFQLSGGMRQRAMIAMALVCGPKLVIADEPTTALDVTTQAQILRLLAQLQRELSMSVLFVTHDMGVVAQIADHVVVMYRGTVVESGPVMDIFHAPKHEYTRSLLASVAALQQPRWKRRLHSEPAEEVADYASLNE